MHKDGDASTGHKPVIRGKFGFINLETQQRYSNQLESVILSGPAFLVSMLNFRLIGGKAIIVNRR